VHDEGRAFVESGGFTIDDVRELMPGTVLDDTTTSALVHTLGRVAAETGDLATAYIQKVEQGQTQPGAGSQEERDWLTAFGGVASTHPQRLGVMAEAGRSLGILNDPLSSTNQMLNMVGQLAQQAAGLDSYKLAQQYINLLQRAGGKEAVKFAQKAVTPGYGGMVLELYYQGMLSNPKTWLTNEVSNALTAAWALPVRLMAGVYSQTVGSGEITLGETAAYAYGLMHQVQRAWQLSGEAFTTGLPQYGKDIPGLMEPVGQGKATGPALTVANLQANGMPIDPNSPYGQLADFWFEWVGLASGGRLGTKIMLSRDEFYKTLNYGGELGALAYRKAMIEGSTSQEKFADTMARVLGEPLPEEMHLAANQHALIQTFQNEMMGAIGKMGGAIQNLSVDVPGLGPFPLGRMIMPFLHIAVNIPRYALENSPLGFFFKSVRDDIAAGGARGDMAMGKMLMGSLTAATFGLMASSGLITGRGPEDKDLRAAMVRAGWQPYSMYVPWLGQHGGYVSLQRLDPIVGQHAGIMADIIEAWGEQEVSMVERAVMGTAFAIISNIGSRSWMRGTSEFFDIMAPRSMRAFEGESKFEGLRGFARGQLSSLAPAVWSVVQKTSDPATKAAWDLADGFRQKVPGWAPLPESATAAALPNYRNKWGDKRLLGWGWSPDWLNWVEGFTEAISPLKVTTLVRDPLDRELLANQIRLSMPTRTLGIRGPQDAPGEGAEDAYAAAEAADPYAAKRIVLTSAQYERRVALAANNREAIQELGMTVNDKAVEQLRRDVGGHTGERLPSAVPGDLYSVLLWATTTKRYQEGMPGPQGDKEEILRRIDRDFRQFGDTQLMANDAELRQQYLTGKALQDLQRTPLPHRERLRGLQEQQLRREEERLRVGAPR
jgi:hypothetical protein